MIISRLYARKLVRAGKARETGLILGYVSLDRLDCARTDHYWSTPADQARLGYQPPR